MIPEGWLENVRLEQIADINPKRDSEIDENQSVSFIGMADVSEEARLVNSQERIYKEVSKGFTAFKDEDVLVAKITPCFENGKGAVVRSLINGTGFGSTEFHVIRTNNKSDNTFLYYHTVSSSFRLLGESNMTGSAGQRRISTDFIKSYKISLPPLPEQKKIASILFSVDEAIQATQKVIDQTQKVKKGLLQELLTKGIGHTEFKKTEIGEIPVEWKIFSLEQVSTLSIDCKNRTPPVINTGYPVVRTSNVRNGSFVYKDLRYTDIQSYKIWTKRGIPKVGDILFTREAPLGEVALIPNDLDNLCLGQRMMLFRINPEKGLNTFVLQALLAPHIKKRLLLNSGGSTVGHARVGDIKNFKIPLPKMNEQNVISSILCSIDSSIINSQKKLEQLQLTKKGLMQDLLTGKVRVKV